MFTLESTVGCLVEARVHAMRSNSDVEALGRAFADVARRLRGTDLVICGDYRAFAVLAPGAANEFLGVLQSANPRLLRSALLVSPTSPTAALQIERIVQESDHPKRRAFRSGSALRAMARRGSARPRGADTAFRAFLQAGASRE